MRYVNQDPEDREGVFYSDAVEAGGMLFVSGCTPLDAQGVLVGGMDAAAQFGATLDNIASVLDAAGYDLSTLVKLTVYLTDIRDIPALGRPRAERFGTQVRPATTVVEVSALMTPGMRVEADAIAVKPAGDR